MLKSGSTPTKAHKVELEKIQLVYSIAFCSVKQQMFTLNTKTS